MQLTKTIIPAFIVGVVVFFAVNSTLPSEYTNISDTSEQIVELKLKDKKSQLKMKAITDELETLIEHEQSESLVKFTSEDLTADINTIYPKISVRVKTVIVRTILTESAKYDINPLILYSLLHTESTMRPWIEHKRVLIKIKKKKKYIRAVGLGGVVWEWWGTSLKKEGIADVRSDLFDPEVNIKAVAFIYNKFYQKKKLKIASTQDESAMIRYFGGGYKSYFLKIDKKIAQLISVKLYRN